MPEFESRKGRHLTLWSILYLPAFRAGVQKGNASGIMCSYNAETYGSGVYGPGAPDQHGAIPSCANKGLLNDLARAQWGFDAARITVMYKRLVFKYKRKKHTIYNKMVLPYETGFIIILVLKVN